MFIINSRTLIRPSETEKLAAEVPGACSFCRRQLSTLGFRVYGVLRRGKGQNPVFKGSLRTLLTWSRTLPTKIQTCPKATPSVP